MSISRKLAVGYAKRNWNKPAEDGGFYLSNQWVEIASVRAHNVLNVPWWRKAPVSEGWMPMFVNDGRGREKAVFRRTASGIDDILINPWEGIADCAHFLSCCLTAGGAHVSDTGVSGLVSKLQARGDTKTLCERVSRQAAQRVIDTGIVKEADMVGYFNVDPNGDYDGRQDYAHSTMFTEQKNASGFNGVACHTICRFPGLSWVEDSWWLHDGYTYTIIHFNDGDPTPNGAIANDIQGWWKLDYAGRTEYYLMNKNGTAHYTKRAPAKGQMWIGNSEGSAYWFMDPSGKITFTWRKTGTVEVWTQDGSGGYASMINGMTPGILTQL